MTDQPHKLPQVAEKPIKMVLAQFMEEQRAQLKPATAQQYQDDIELLELFLNDYGHSTLTPAEDALYEQLCEGEDNEERRFCDIFGPEKIPETVGEVLGYFIIRKVICSRQTMTAAGRTVKKLGQWLQQKGYIDAEVTGCACESRQGSRSLV